jgi:GAF domain-containing protein
MMRLSPESSQVLAGLLREVADVREERKLWSMTLGALASRFGADSGAIFLYKRSMDGLYKVRSLREGETWDTERLYEFFHNRKPLLEATVIMAPVRAGQDVIGVLALGRKSPFDRGVGKEATEMLKAVGRWAGLRRQLAEQKAERAIANALLWGVAPRDVTYRILHELRRLVGYNHGATVVGIVDGDKGRVLARQAAWSKGKSDLVGREIPVNWARVSTASGPAIVTRADTIQVEPLFRLREKHAPEKRSIMVGPLEIDETLLGLVEVSSSIGDFFVETDKGKLARLLPYLAWCVDNFYRRTGGCDE